MRNNIILLFTLFYTSTALIGQTEYGNASFYGMEFNGKPTASGEIYSQNKLTAAHKTLPLGTVLKVTNAQNNKSVYVKINDRGPYAKGRIIDLSTKAAELLGYRNKGTAYVKIEVVQPESTPADLLKASLEVIPQKSINNEESVKSGDTLTIPVANSGYITIKNGERTKTEQPEREPATEIKEANANGLTNRNAYFIITRLDKSKSGFYGLQIGVFSDMNSILSVISELEAKYHQTLLVEQADLHGKAVYKLFIGKYQNRAYADALKSALADKYTDAFVVKYE